MSSKASTKVSAGCDEPRRPALARPCRGRLHRGVGFHGLREVQTFKDLMCMGINKKESKKREETQIVVQICTIFLFFVVMLFSMFDFGHVSDMSPSGPALHFTPQKK